MPPETWSPDGGPATEGPCRSWPCCHKRLARGSSTLGWNMEIWKLIAIICGYDFQPCQQCRESNHSLPSAKSLYSNPINLNSQSSSFYGKLKASFTLLWPPHPFVKMSIRVRQEARRENGSQIPPFHLEALKNTNKTPFSQGISNGHFGTSLEHLEAMYKASGAAAWSELQHIYPTAAAKFPCFVSWKWNQLRILDFSHAGNSKLLPQTSWLETFPWKCSFSCLGSFRIKCSHLQSPVLSDGALHLLRAVVLTHGTNYRYPLLYGIQMGYPGTLLLPTSLCSKDLFPQLWGNLWTSFAFLADGRTQTDPLTG